jgi:7,8-dihydroneopterin aldolase/epimerase/oxygenase
VEGDRVEVRGLRVDAVHGVLPSERLGPQPFEIDLDVYLDTAPAASSDDLADTVDYGAAVEAVLAVMRGAPHNLLESLAAALAEAVLAGRGVESVTVRVRKLRPPLEHDVASTGVRVHRRRAAAP